MQLEYIYKEVITKIKLMGCVGVIGVCMHDKGVGVITHMCVLCGGIYT